MRRFLARLWLGRYREELLGCSILALFGSVVWVWQYVTAWAQRHGD